MKTVPGLPVYAFYFGLPAFDPKAIVHGVLPIETHIAAIIPEIQAIRRDLHAHPELGFRERRTAQVISRYLKRLPGMLVETGVAGTGVVGLLGHDRPSPCIGLRADMDCLPITEETGLPYASREKERMHACGHDGHMAALLGAAKILSTVADDLPGPVKFIFQPAEEGLGGAKRMIEAGVLENPEVAVIYGFHNFPSARLRENQIGLRSGPFMGGSYDFRIKIHGRGGHAAFPELACDPIRIGSRLVGELPGFVSRCRKGGEVPVITVTHFDAGNTTNVIPDTALLEGTIRSLSPEILASAPGQFTRFVKEICAKSGARGEVDLIPGYPVTCNESAATARVRRIVTATWGKEALFDDFPPVLASEDFSYYLQERPGCFYFIGTADDASADVVPLHHPKFDFNDRILARAISLHCRLAMEER